MDQPQPNGRRTVFIDGDPKPIPDIRPGFTMQQMNEGQPGVFIGESGGVFVGEAGGQFVGEDEDTDTAPPAISPGAADFILDQSDLDGPDELA